MHAAIAFTRRAMRPPASVLGGHVKGHHRDVRLPLLSSTSALLFRPCAGANAFATVSAPLYQQAAMAPAPSAPSSGSVVSFPDQAVPILKLTPRAVLKLKQLAAKNAEGAAPGTLTGLRVSVYEGGCHGLEYRFNLEKNIPLASLDAEDVVLEQEGAKVILDAISVEKMQGSILDFIQDLQGEMFSIVHNPLAGASCGCGSSFSPKA